MNKDGVEMCLHSMRAIRARMVAAINIAGPAGDMMSVNILGHDMEALDIVTDFFAEHAPRQSKTWAEQKCNACEGKGDEAIARAEHLEAVIARVREAIDIRYTLGETTWDACNRVLAILDGKEGATKPSDDRCPHCFGERATLLARAEEAERDAASLTLEARSVIRDLIRAEQDREIDIPRERSLDRVEEEFAHVCKVLRVREDWL